MLSGNEDFPTLLINAIKKNKVKPYDAITELPKPKIIVEEGTIFATAEGSLKNSDIEAELIKSTDFTTPLGIINVYKAKNTMFTKQKIEDMLN